MQVKRYGGIQICMSTQGDDFQANLATGPFFYRLEACQMVWSGIRNHLVSGRDPSQVPTCLHTHMRDSSQALDSLVVQNMFKTLNTYLAIRRDSKKTFNLSCGRPIRGMPGLIWFRTYNSCLGTISWPLIFYPSTHEARISITPSRNAPQHLHAKMMFSDTIVDPPRQRLYNTSSARPRRSHTAGPRSTPSPNVTAHDHLPRRIPRNLFAAGFASSSSVEAPEKSCSPRHARAQSTGFTSRAKLTGPMQADSCRFPRRNNSRTGDFSPLERHGRMQAGTRILTAEESASPEACRLRAPRASGVGVMSHYTAQLRAGCGRGS